MDNLKEIIETFKLLSKMETLKCLAPILMGLTYASCVIFVIFYKKKHIRQLNDTFSLYQAMYKQAGWVVISDDLFEHSESVVQVSEEQSICLDDMNRIFPYSFAYPIMLRCMANFPDANFYLCQVYYESKEKYKELETSHNIESLKSELNIKGS